MNKLNKYLSNLADWNVQLHNLHWNVVGHAFVQIHEFSEKLYDEVFEQFDAVAEIQKMHNKQPLVKMSEYLQNASIQELDAKEFSAIEVLKIIEADMKEMSSLAREIRDEAGKEDNFQVANMFEDYISSFSKNLWFISAMLKE
jgi:starvation-inducible DNA-binding protein